MATIPRIMSSNLTRASCLLRSQLYTTIRLSYRDRPPVATTASPQLSRALPSSRPVSTAPPKALKMTSPSLKRHESSPERIIQRQIAAGDVDKWGWVVYRTAYQPELDTAWAALQRLVLEDLREGIAQSDAPEIADRMDWAFVADPELDGASLDKLKRSCAHVNLVRAWADPLPEEKATDADGEPVDNENWMKIHLGVVSPHYYVELGDDETCYAYYRAPPDGMCMP
ncbi:hypothetical protein V2G26_010369 [Clonostachys chloroleuca]